jgi:hypothetical protein
MAIINVPLFEIQSKELKFLGLNLIELRDWAFEP